jgi:aromatic ring-opening dioxygenase catalytic subunit (LigB family)
MKDTTIFNIIVKSSVDENKQDNLQEVINIYNDYKEIEKELRNKMFDSPMYVGIGKW